jgi:hypothetical protein
MGENLRYTGGMPETNVEVGNSGTDEIGEAERAAAEEAETEAEE